MCHEKYSAAAYLGGVLCSESDMVLRGTGGRRSCGVDARLYCAYDVFDISVYSSLNGSRAVLLGLASNIIR